MRYPILFLLMLQSACLQVVIQNEAPETCKQGKGTIVLAGGGAEGDLGDESAWSFSLYGALVENGDLNGDGVIRVSILATEASAEPSFLPNYFVWLGEVRGLTVKAENFILPTRQAAEDPEVLSKIASSDAIFIKGGDQGVYYDQWNSSALELAIRGVVVDCKGAIGGTSAGAMSLSQYSFSGSRDLIAEDVLTDSHTSFLDDDSTSGTSGIHDDFLPFVPNILVDTHYTARGRMGRLLGIMGKAAEDFQDHGFISIGLEERTGVVIQDQTAKVIGTGEVSFLQETAQTILRRTPGAPLQYSFLRLDRLTHGWSFNLNTKQPLTRAAPKDTQLVVPQKATYTQDTSLLIRGDLESDRQRFSRVATIFPNEYSNTPTAQSSFIEGSIGFTDCGETDSRMDKQETLFRALFDAPGEWGFLLFFGGALQRDLGSPKQVLFTNSGQQPPMGGIAIDSSKVTHKGLSPFVSNWAADQNTLHAAAMIGLIVHVVAPSQTVSLGE
jgi:cyanophycinase-like exopeptidase